MRRRPLYMLAVLLTLLVMVLQPPSRDQVQIPDGTAVTFTGRVERREEREGQQILYLTDTDISPAGIIPVYLKNSDSRYLIGNTLTIKGTIQKLKKADNPGEFDSRLYYLTQKITARCYADEVSVQDPQYRPVPEMLCRLRLRWEIRLDRWLGEEEAGTMKAMLLGDRAGLSAETRQLYRGGGISHLLAISGLHVSLLGIGLYRILRRLGLSAWEAGPPMLLLLALFSQLVGAGVSTLRAVFMCALLIGADLLGRTYDTRSALGLAAILLLAEQPLYARNSAFLLSFSAVFAAAEILPLLEWLLPPSRYIRKGLRLSLSIQIMTFPLLLYFFYEASLYGMFLNLLVIPMMSVLLGCGCICLLSDPGCAADLVSRAAAFTGSLILRFFSRFSGLAAGLPGAVYCGGCPQKWQMVFYYTGLAFLLIWGNYRKKKAEESKREKKSRLRSAVGLLVYMLLLFFLLWRPQPDFRVTMLDVGQGDCIVMQNDNGSIWVMDAGSSSDGKIGTRILEPYLKYLGSRRIDYLLLSHMDEDHISGIRELLETEEIYPGSACEVGCLILPRQAAKSDAGQQLCRLAKEKEIPVRFLKKGDRIRESGLAVACLWPEEDTSAENSNNASMVLSVEHGTFRMLLTGDLEEEGEQEILRAGLPCRSYDVLKTAHHGSRFSTGEDWLKAVRPKISLISCGEHNSYGHPHNELLERLEAGGSTVFRTDRDGAVEITVKGEKVRVKKYG